MHHRFIKFGHSFISFRLLKLSLTFIIAAGAVAGIACSLKSSKSELTNMVVTGETRNPLSDLETAAAAGRSLYLINCSLCHGKEGRGDGVSRDALAAKPVDLTSGAILSDTDGAIFLVIRDGKMNGDKMTMPPVKDLTNEQIWQIVAYVRTLGKR